MCPRRGLPNLNREIRESSRRVRSLRLPYEPVKGAGASFCFSNEGDNDNSTKRTRGGGAGSLCIRVDYRECF